MYGPIPALWKDSAPMQGTAQLPQPFTAKPGVYHQRQVFYAESSHWFADFEKLPDDLADRKQFAELFKEFNDYLAAAKIQGFRWDKTIYVFNKSTPEENTIEILIDKVTYDTLLIRYKELFSDEPSEKGKVESVPYDVDGYLIAINTDKINADFLNSRFKKYIQSIEK